MQGTPPRAVTFDFWDTLIAQNPNGARRRQDLWSAELALAGHELEGDVLDAAFTSGWEWFEEAWHANVQVTAAEWTTRTVDLLGVDLAQEVRDRLTARVVEGTDPSHMRLADNAAATLRALHQAGTRIGIICDVGLTPSATLRRYLEHHDVLRYFHHWSFSDEVGVFKPDGRIFAHALEGLGVEAAEAVHIGDLRRTDVAGARAAGWTSVRYRGLNDDPGSPELGTDAVEADHVLDDHAALPATLGLA